jgi:hypothetical protein
MIAEDDGYASHALASDQADLDLIVLRLASDDRSEPTLREIDRINAHISFFEALMETQNY